MKTSTEVLADIDVAFGNVPKPDHFMDHAHCQECEEHDELLRNRDRSSLKIEDVGNIGWQPISSCSPEGMAYYMPALTRLALNEPTYNYGWYGDTLQIHLSHNGAANEFLRYCTPEQRRAVSKLLWHLRIARQDYEMRLTEVEEFEQCAKVWYPEFHDQAKPSSESINA